MPSYEVVLLKNGVSEFAAKPEDFRRVPVDADTTLGAQIHDDVQKVCGAEGFYPLFAVPPGVLTDPELAASTRDLRSQDLDPRKF